MNLESAKHALEFCHVISADEKGRPEEIFVPGHEIKGYHVKIARETSHFTCDCKDISGEDCPGSSHGKVCYHVLAALMKCVQGKGHLEFFEYGETPIILKDSGRKKTTVLTAKGGGKVSCVFFIYKKKKKQEKIVSETKDSDKPPEYLFNMSEGPYDR